MKNALFLSMLAAAFLGSGVAEAETLYASTLDKSRSIALRDDPLVVDIPLRLEGQYSYIYVQSGATIQFQKKQDANEICTIFSSEQLPSYVRPVSFFDMDAVYNISFDAGAEAILSSSFGTAITLIQDLSTRGDGFSFQDSSSILQLNGVGYNETVELNGTSFKYVGPKPDDYVFMRGEIGFTGFVAGSHALSLVVGGGSVPEPATGTLSLLALAGLCARRRKK